jgi:hypothetical protein
MNATMQMPQTPTTAEDRLTAESRNASREIAEVCLNSTNDLALLTPDLEGEALATAYRRIRLLAQIRQLAELLTATEPE